MKIGVKAYGFEQELIDLETRTDFFEVMALEGKDYSQFKKIKIPLTIHAQHQVFGINNANKKLEEKNKKSLLFAIKLADEFGADKIVVHPGELNDSDCSLENSINFFKQFNDSRIIIENMPSKNHLCGTPEELNFFVRKLNLGICFDFNHAIQFALTSKQDYNNFIKEFLKLKPNYFHIGGQKFDGTTHLAFSESEINLEPLIKSVPDKARIALETSNNLNEKSEELDFIKSLI